MWPAVGAIIALVVGTSSAETGPAARLDALANRFVAQWVAFDPTVGEYAGLPMAGHDGLADPRPKAAEAFAAQERTDLAELNAIDRGMLPASARAPYAILKEKLEADLQLRVCRTELWDVNHMSGWQNDLVLVAERQPVGSATAREEAIRRWGAIPGYVDARIANLRQGLDAGYSAPKSVVRRVVAQMDKLASGTVEASPFYSPAARDGDAAFKRAFARIVAERMQPAFARYRDFLRDVYLPRAREGVAISDLPDGAACYQAFLRSFTTLNRSPQAVFDLGSRAVEANRREVTALGGKMYGLSDFAAIVARTKADPSNHFKSRDELLAYSREVVERGTAMSAGLVDAMPAQGVVVEPEPIFEDDAGVPSHFEPNPDVSKPAVYRIELSVWNTTTKGEAAITALHEANPGHHLQIARSRELQPDTLIAKAVVNSAYLEGWARHAERMSEEAGLYPDRSALVMRRVWPARGMVVDPGLHALHWSRKQAIDYLIESGRFDAKTADDMVDRIAVMPGQLTAYDTGGLEILALEEEATRALGARFDLRRFNRTVLEEGVVPLSELREHVEAWIRAEGGQTAR